ncbi:reverse transcriptase domain-containing protein [Tanacetum coccineum]
MVTSEGIRANPKKTKAISDLQSPKTLKEMQSLSGKLASLNRFLAKSAERALPFFNTLKNITKENKHEYRWTAEAEEAFQQMKGLIMSLPSLTPPYPEETLYAYLAVSREAVSAVLLTDRNGRQCPVQYVSRTLNEAERNYSPLEKLALSLVNMTRRLRRYFEAHPVKVITDQPIKNILSRTEVSGKLAKYAVEIGTYKISFIPRNAVKGQVLADFLSDAPDGEREDEYFQSPEVSPEIDDTEAWTLYTDGAASSKGSGAGLVLTGPSGDCEKCLCPPTSPLKTYQEEAIRRLCVSKASHRAVPPLTKEILSRVLNERSTEVQEVQTIVEEEGDNWMTPIIKYLEEGIDLFRQIMSFGKFTWDLAETCKVQEQIVQLKAIRQGFTIAHHAVQNAKNGEAKYKTKMEQYYNKRVRPAGFRPGEFVYRRNEASRMENEGKLGPNWEGPYRVTEAFENGSYKLQTMEDKVVPRTWHAVNLRKCYL